MPLADPAAVDPPAVRAQVEAGLEFLRAAGRRRTTARTAVLRVLAHAGGHLSFMQIHRELLAAGNPINPSVVWRTLSEFHRVGLIHPLPIPGPPAYGLAHPPHAHAVCTDCGAVTEIALPRLAEAAAAIEALTDFDLEPTGLGLLGTCPTCRTVTAQPLRPPGRYRGGGVVNGAGRRQQVRR